MISAKSIIKSILSPLATKAFGSLYDATKSSGYYAPTPDLNYSHEDLLEIADIELIRSAGREIYANFAPVAGAIHEKATTAVGQHWNPIYYGSDEKWGKIATEWIREYLKVLDVRGQPFNFVNNHWIGSVSLDREGEFFIIPIRNEKTGWPAFQYLDAHTVGTRSVTEDERRFPGWKFRSGVWRNSFGRPMAYRFLGDTPEGDRIVPARNVIHTYDPRWFSQGRGIPSIIQGILDWKDVKKFRENTKTAANVFSSLTVVEKNAEGKPDTTRDYFRSQGKGTTNAVTGQEEKLVIEEYMRGAIRYIRANGKNDLQAFKYDTPPHQVVNFIDSIMRGGFSGMDWPIEQAYDMSGLGTAQVRAITNKCQRAVNRRQQTLLYPAARIIEFAIASASSAGIIPKAPLDWWKWRFALPPKMTADAYREASQDREDYKLGFVTLREIYEKRGELWSDHVEQRFAEEQFFDEKVKETAIQIERVRMLTPNGNPLNEQERNQDEEDDAEDLKNPSKKKKKKKEEDE